MILRVVQRRNKMFLVPSSATRAFGKMVLDMISKSIIFKWAEIDSLQLVLFILRSNKCALIKRVKSDSKSCRFHVKEK